MTEEHASPPGAAFQKQVGEMRAPPAPPIPRNALLDDLIEHCRAERQQHLESIDGLVNHRFRLYTGQTDTSEAWIETLRGYVAELDVLIAKHDAAYG